MRKIIFFELQTLIFSNVEGLFGTADESFILQQDNWPPQRVAIIQEASRSRCCYSAMASKKPQLQFNLKKVMVLKSKLSFCELPKRSLKTIYLLNTKEFGEN